MRTILLTIFVFFNSFLLAQQKKPVHTVPAMTTVKQLPDTWLGIVAGPHLNYLSYHDNTTTIEGNNTGIHVGGFFQRDINKYFAIQPQLLFSIRGGEIQDVDSTVDATLFNIELPINFLFSYNRLMLGAGPNFCYGINGKLKSNGVSRDAYDASESFERTLKRFEVGANFMIAYSFPDGVFLSVNFSPGFTNIYEGDGSAPTNVKANTRVFGISLGYTFGISGE